MNNHLSYVIVDDDSLSRLMLDGYLQQHPFLKSIAVFSSANHLISFLKTNKVDILFSDIEMPEMNGISLMKEIQSEVSYSVFVTSHPDYAVESYKLNVNDYLLKPFDEVKVNEVVARISSFFELKKKADLYDINIEENKNVMIKDGRSHRVVNSKNITYLIAVKDYSKLVLENNETIMMHGNLSSLLRDKMFDDFVRIHKSYAVKKQAIKMVDSTSVTLINDVILPLGRSYKKDILSLFS